VKDVFKFLAICFLFATGMISPMLFTMLVDVGFGVGGVLQENYQIYRVEPGRYNPAPPPAPAQ
jgi:hypothetical protein